ncbi:cytochrome P450 [Fennellomyces sp. T-0311]|nr:cytochrome P450 [Fennellomyces sp. T-0311]
MEIPSPGCALPYFGHIFQISKQLTALQFHEWHKKYGPIFQIKMGAQSWILTNDPYVVHEVLGVNGSITGGRLSSTLAKYHTSGNSGIGFLNPDQTWKQNRTLGISMLSPKSVAISEPIIQSEVERATEILLKYSSENSGADTSKHMKFTVMNVIMQITFGLHAESIDDPLTRSMLYNIEKAIELSDIRDDIGAFLPLFAPIIDIFTQKEKVIRDYVNNSLNPLFSSLIDAGYKSDAECFVKHLRTAMEDGNRINEEGIIELCTELAGAAVDATAMTLAWGFVILCHHKDLQLQIQKEIDTFIAKHNRLPIYKEREYFPLLLSAQKECMRYRTSAQFNFPHVVQNDLNYKGNLIPKGTIILGNVYSLCRNPERYDSPDEFKPERYLHDTRQISAAVKGNADTREHYLFGWGRRICPGVHLSEVILFHVWIRILAAAVIEPLLDKNGNPSYPNLNALRDAGIVIGPGESRIRFVKRTDHGI